MNILMKRLSLATFLMLFIFCISLSASGDDGNHGVRKVTEYYDALGIVNRIDCRNPGKQCRKTELETGTTPSDGGAP
jgi:hypothetical protein